MNEIQRISDLRFVEEAKKFMTPLFLNDPLMVKLFEGSNKSKHIENFFDYMIYSNIARKEITLGLYEDSHLIGVAMVETTTGLHGKQLLRKPAFVLKTVEYYFRTPRRALRIINDIVNHINHARPKVPHHYIHYVGVMGKLQGKGIGRRFLEYINEIVEADSKSIGVGLDTENDKNVSLCLKLGYQLVSQKTFDDLTIYCLFKPKKINEI